MRLYLNTESCQFSFSKTTKSVSYIQNKSISSDSEENNVLSVLDYIKPFISYFFNFDKKRKDIFFIFTNNSQTEKQQWNIRLDLKDNENYKFKVISFSSEDNINQKDNVAVELFNKKENDDINCFVVIMCTNGKRIDDIQSILNTDKHFPNTNVSIIFDEFDNFLKPIMDFYQKIKELEFISSLIFTSATVCDEKIWKEFNKNGIYEFENFDNELGHQDYELHCENYRKLDEHHKIIEECVECEQKEPNRYIRRIYEKHIKQSIGKKIIFAPSHAKKSHHNEIIEFFKNENFVSILINGDFKGFIYPDGTKISFVDYRNRYKISGELYFVLSHFHKSNNYDILITGNKCIERGVTFITNEFTFTHAIYSDYHMQNIRQILQFIGRCLGHKKFVEAGIIIIAPEKIFNQCNSSIQKLLELKILKVEKYTEKDFDKDNFIPIKLNLTKTEFESLISKNKKDFSLTLISLVNENKSIIPKIPNKYPFEPEKRNIFKITKEFTFDENTINNNCPIKLKKIKDNEYIVYKTDKLIVIGYKPMEFLPVLHKLQTKSKPKGYRIYNDLQTVKMVCKELKYGFKSPDNKEGEFYLTSLANKKHILSLDDAIRGYATKTHSNKKTTWRTYLPCYENINDEKTLKFLLILRPETSDDDIKLIDKKYPQNN